MADDKTKRGRQDRSRINIHESYELDFEVKQLKKELPRESILQLKRDIVSMAMKPALHQNRKMMRNAIRVKYGKDPK